jgi:uncharacterized protein YbaA (DUF1428 family)
MSQPDNLKAEVATMAADDKSDPALTMFVSALRADENDEAVYGWAAEESASEAGESTNGRK